MGHQSWSKVRLWLIGVKWCQLLPRGVNLDKEESNGVKLGRLTSDEVKVRSIERMGERLIYKLVKSWVRGCI